jgi:hypothetical protein
MLATLILSTPANSPNANPLGGLIFLVGLIYGLVVSTKRWRTLGVAVLTLVLCCVVVILAGLAIHLSPEGMGTIAGTMGFPFSGIAAAFHGNRNKKPLG